MSRPGQLVVPCTSAAIPLGGARMSWVMMPITMPFWIMPPRSLQVTTRGSMPGMGHSGAARAGMVSFTETAALEWAKSGVRVNAVAPGYIASSGMDHYPPEAAPMLREMATTVPAGRFGTEAETSAGIVFLLSPAAAFITGVTLQIDGGASLGSPLFPSVDHDRSVPFDGFHRAVTPEVLREKDA